MNSSLGAGKKAPFFTREAWFYKTFFRLLAVIALQQLAALAVNLVDNIMLGRYTELALSGATLVNQLQFILQQIAAGIGMGVSVLGSQYWGKNEPEPIKRITGVGLKFALGAGLIFMLMTRFFPGTVLGIFTNDAAVIAEGSKYLRIMCWTYIIFAVSNTLMYSLQSVGTAFIGMVMSLSTIVINMCLNYCLIYGNLGCPELGITGAAIATLTSRIVELVIITGYVLIFDKKLRMRVADLLSLDMTYLGDFSKAALPVMVSGALWGVAQSAQTVILGHMSATVIAASSIASIVFQIFVVVGSASASTASVTMGMTVGSGRLEAVRPYSRTMQAIFLTIGVVSATAMFLCRGAIVSFYSVSPEAKELAKQFLVVLSAASVGSCYEFPVESGIIAGGGDPKYQAIVDNAFMWLFSIPTAALAAFVFGAPAPVVFCFLKADQLLKCIPNSIVCNRYKWVKVLTRGDG